MSRSWLALRVISVKPHLRGLTTSPCPRFPRYSESMPSASTPRHHGTVTSDEEIDISELGAECFGTYSVILPPEPFVFGVSHITQRPVPSHIPRPPYATPFAHDQSTVRGSFGDECIQLGSPGEWRLRRAARLAREVLEYAGTLVKVKACIVIRQLR